VIQTKFSKDQFQSIFYEEILELLKDTDYLVSFEILEGIVEIMPSKILPQQVTDDILPEILRLFKMDKDKN
jgi:hypothetical protein